MLGLVGMGWPTVALSNCSETFKLEQLKGKAYTNLPKDLCPRYTDMLLGSTKDSPEYGGVICDRPEATYILLQKLLQQTADGKAVWQVIQVKSVARSTPQSFVMGTGCRLAQSQSQSLAEPIFALVQMTSSNTYQTLSAWKVNLTDASFTDLKPQQVVCKNVLTSI
jgi:hypothetical protein